MEFDHLTERGRAVGYLADRLTDGTLVAFLGAGASTASGLPDWKSLVARLLERAGIDEDLTGATADRFQVLADKVRRDFCHSDERAFARLVSECLYAGVSLSSALLRSDLLIALGALMMGSRRGSVSRVVSFNFDSTLEWYMSLHGMVSRVIVQPPQLEGSEDVRVYHPHGFLPHPDAGFQSSNFVILGAQSVNSRIGRPGDPWFEGLRHLLRTGVGIVIGMSLDSFRDRAIAPLLEVVGTEVKATRPTAFWLLRESDSGQQKEIGDEMLASNVVPVFVADFDEIPPFLLSICQKAAAKTALA